MVSHIEIYSKLYNEEDKKMSYFDIKKDSLEEVISKARGKWTQKEIGSVRPWVIASFHPAFLMRQPEQKKFSWIDLKMIRDKSKVLKI